MTTHWNSSRSTGDTSAFLKACHLGSLDSVKVFIKQRDLKSLQKATDETKKTGLHLAAKNGNTEIVVCLITNGWELDARDRLSTTPLQHACLAGHLETVNLLLTKGADSTLQDNIGRSAIHYSCCCADPEVMRFLLSKNRNLISQCDNSGCCALHYAVFNSGIRQVDMIRILLEYGAEVDSVDNVGKTPLHHAAETGKKRCIPILIKHGANVYARESVHKKTTLELSLNPKVEELIVMYGPEQLKKDHEDRKQIEVEVSQIKDLFIDRTKKVIDNETRSLWASKVNSARNRSQSTNRSIGNTKNEWRTQLVQFMREVQIQGIISQQHDKKPYLYSGSWIEGIQDAAGFMQALGICTAAEAALRVFNILEPYPRKMPEGKEYEPIFDTFFGGYSSLNPEHSSSVKINSTQQDNREIRQMLVEKDEALGFIKRENETLKKELQQSRQKYINMVQQMPKKEDLLLAISEKENANRSKENYKFQLKDVNFKLQQALSQLEYYQTQLEKLPKLEEFEALQHKLASQSKTDEILRAKAGQLFLSSLDRRFEREAESPALELQDDIVLARFASLVENNSLSLAQRLQDVDSNKDGRVTKSELNMILIGLGVSPQDMIVLFKLAGFKSETYSIKSRDLCILVSNRQKLRNKLEKELFRRLKNNSSRIELNSEQVFEFLDSNKDGKVNFQELSSAMDTLQMMVSRADKYAIFSVLDQDRNGFIHLEELNNRLQNLENIIDEEIELKEEQPIDVQNEELEIVQPTVIQRKRIEQLPKEDPYNILGISKEMLFNPSELRKKVIKVFTEDKPNSIQPNPNYTQKSKSSTNLQKDKLLSGTIAIQIVRGRSLGESSHSVHVFLDGVDNNLKTDLKPGDNPEWKFRGRIKLIDKRLVSLSDSIQFRVMGIRGLECLVDIPWLHSLEFPNTWEVNNEFELKALGGRKKGSIVVQIKWIPKEELRVEVGGSLMINGVSGFERYVMEFNIENNVCQVKQEDISTITDIRLVKNKPIPPMKCAYLELESRKLLYMCNVSWEVALSTQTWTPPLTVNLSTYKSISIRLKWIPNTPERQNQEKAATKLQAFARGYQARVLKPINQHKNQLISRRGLAYDGRYYLISILQSFEGYLATLHIADDPSIPMYDIIHTLSISDLALVEIEKRIKITAGPKLMLKGNEQVSTVNGDLYIECLDGKDLCKCFFGMNCCGVYAFSTVGPPFDRKVSLVNVYAMGYELPAIEVTAFNIEDRSQIDSTKISWTAAFDSPQTWIDSQVKFTKSTLRVKILWNPYDPQKTDKETAALKIKQAWKHKPTSILSSSPSKLIARRGIKRNERYFLVSILQDDSNFQIQINLADDPGTPVWIILDSLRVSNDTDIEFIFNHIEISSDLHAALPNFT